MKINWIMLVFISFLSCFYKLEENDIISYSRNRILVKDIERL